MEVTMEIPLIVDGASGSAELESHMAKLLSELFALWKRKNLSYGTGNIAKFGEFGCLVRASDKMERLINLQKVENPLKDESIEDTWLDMADYALMAILCRRGLWPK
jgi:hypothetical protein